MAFTTGSALSWTAQLLVLRPLHVPFGKGNAAWQVPLQVNATSPKVLLNICLLHLVLRPLRSSSEEPPAMLAYMQIALSHDSVSVKSVTGIRDSRLSTLCNA